MVLVDQSRAKRIWDSPKLRKNVTYFFVSLIIITIGINYRNFYIMLIGVVSFVFVFYQNQIIWRKYYP